MLTAQRARASFFVEFCALGVPSRLYKAIGSRVLPRLRALQCSDVVAYMFVVSCGTRTLGSCLHLVLQLPDLCAETLDVICCHHLRAGFQILYDALQASYKRFDLCALGSDSRQKLSIRLLRLDELGVHLGSLLLEEWHQMREVNFRWRERVRSTARVSAGIMFALRHPYGIGASTGPPFALNSARFFRSFASSMH